MVRDYIRSHPWLTFSAKLDRAPIDLWLLLGEARSKCRHIREVPLREDTARELYVAYLVKGAQATTAIEGNTLTEEQVRAQYENRLQVPRTLEYQRQEVQNVLDGFGIVSGIVLERGRLEMSVDFVRHLNRLVLQNLDLDSGVSAGQFPDHAVAVGSYRGVPPADREYLLQRLCDWLNGPDFGERERLGVGIDVIHAVLAHLYLAWIHPFGDGNGRTARLVEFGLLLAGGVPAASAHLLSNHFNRTRAEYYRQLQGASDSGGDVIPFLVYAIRGFVDGLQEQIHVVQQQLFQLVWRDLVDQRLADRSGPTAERQRRLAGALYQAEGPILKRTVRTLTPELAVLYAGKTAKTVTRDVNALARWGLVSVDGQRVTARKEVVQGLRSPVLAADE